MTLQRTRKRRRVPGKAEGTTEGAWVARGNQGLFAQTGELGKLARGVPGPSGTRPCSRTCNYRGHASRICWAQKACRSVESASLVHHGLGGAIAAPTSKTTTVHKRPVEPIRLIRIHPPKVVRETRVSPDDSFTLHTLTPPTTLRKLRVT